MNYGKVEERSSSRSRSANTARRAATSAILTDILSRSDRAPTSPTADARPGKSILIIPERVVADSEKGYARVPCAVLIPSLDEKRPCRPPFGLVQVLVCGLLLCGKEQVMHLERAAGRMIFERCPTCRTLRATNSKIQASGDA